MKLKFLILNLLFFSLIGICQTDTSSKFRDNFYIEINAGLGRLNYLDNFPSYDIYSGNKIDHYFKKHSLLFPFGIDFIFRNTFFKLGGTLFSKTRLTGYFDQTWKGYLGLNLFPRSKIYLGPSLTYSSYYRKYLNNDTPVNVFDSWSFGTDFYFHKFHFNLNYSVYKNRYNDILVSNLRDINFCVGYGFNTSSFSKKNREKLSLSKVKYIDTNSKTRFIDNFYLEFNLGSGFNKYKDEVYNNQGLSGYKNAFEILLNLDLNFQFRNKYFKSGISIIDKTSIYGDLDNNWSLLIGANVLPKKIKNLYFGPFISYSTFYEREHIGKVKGALTHSFDCINGGVDFYFKKFHIDLYYSKFVNKIPDYDFLHKLQKYGIDIGYCFNLDSFRRKNRK